MPNTPVDSYDRAVTEVAEALCALSQGMWSVPPNQRQTPAKDGKGTVSVARNRKRCRPQFSVKYKVENLLREVTASGKRYVVVKWEGYKEATLEPVEIISEDVPELLDALRRRKRGRRCSKRVC